MTTRQREENSGEFFRSVKILFIGFIYCIWYNISMNTHLEQLLNDEKYFSLSRDLNFDYNENITPELYKEEVSKFSRYFFYQTRLNGNLARVDNINDMLLYYNDNMLNYIRTLYDSAVTHNDSDSILAISYIVYSIYKSFVLEPYKSNEHLRDYQAQFKKYFSHQALAKGSHIRNNCIEFAKQILEEINEEYSVFFERISVECIHILYYNDIDTSMHFEKFLSRDNLYFLDEIIKYDKNLAENFEAYFNYQINCLIDDYDLTILKHLYKKQQITLNDEKEIINKIVEYIKAYEKNDDYFTKTHKFESIIRTLNTIIGISNLSASAKEVFSTLRRKAYSIKRSIIINVDDSMFHTHKFKFDIEQKKFDEFKHQFERNPFEAIAQHCIVNFENNIENCVESRTKFVFHLFADVMTTDEEGLVYRRNENEIESEFGKYYNNLFNTFLENSKKRIPNQHIFTQSNGYNYLMEYMKDIFSLQVSLIGAWIKETSKEIAYESTLYIKLNPLPNYNNNYYIMLLEIIIQIESLLIKIYNYLLNSNVSNFSEDMLESIFIQFKESKYSKFLLNGITYINFILYDKLGLQYRNKLAHGKFKSGIKDDKVFLGILTSWIIASAISEDLSKGHQNDEVNNE